MIASGPRHILLVEDSRTQAARAQLVLEDAGYSVTIARDGEAAWERIGAERFDIIVSDINMPGIDGYELCRRAKAHATERHTPFVLLTDHEELTALVRGVEVGADDFILKPWTPAALIGRIAAVLRDMGPGGAEAAVGSIQRMTELLMARTKELEDANRELDRRQLQLKAMNRELEAERSALEVSNQQLELANRQLEEATRHKSEFLANMSHELRTPLNAILGFSQLMIDDLPGRIDAKTGVRFLNQINSSGQHLLGLINDILDLSKVEAGQMDLHLAKTAVAETIEMVVTTVEPLATKKDIKVVNEAGSDLYVVADPGKLKQMLLNLVSNGIKFTPAGGQVTIAARRGQSMIEISVVDTGIGMSEADLQFIFQEFRQLDQGPDRQQEGTGLGLALTKRFAELHGGTVSVQSSKGSGSMFTLRLPIEPPNAKTEPTPEGTPMGVTNLTRPLILVVEDNPPAAELLVRYLDRGGFRIEVARTGSEALTKARALKPAAITLDILLPEIDGWEVLTQLKQEDSTRDIPVVVISVVDNPDLGHALGALDYFVKPVDREALLSRLGRYSLTTKVKREEIRILLVDDESPNLDYLESVLQPAGFTVLRASGGQEGIDMARADKPHLVLLDLIMPGVTGFDVVEQLRSEDSTRSIPIMVLTAKQLTEEDKKQLNGFVAAVFERNSLAGPELIGWLHQLVGMP